MTVLVTGAAGFIGAHVAKALLTRGDRVIGVDNFNAYYDPSLKRHRLSWLAPDRNFMLLECDLADAAALSAAIRPHRPGLTHIVHLAAQAGVRHSIEQPLDYLSANLAGHLHMLELARHLPVLTHLVYASSSSVYGVRTGGASSIGDAADTPTSLYAATKRADELMSAAYSRLYRIPQTGLRFFTVYGPAGRPDMAYYAFTEAILSGRPIRVNGDGSQIRDFTFIDDIVAGVLSALDRPPEGDIPHRLFNLGNDRPAPLSHLIEVIEAACGRRAVKDYQPAAAGDVPATWADIGESRRILGYAPRTTLAEGIERFVGWYRGYAGNGQDDHAFITEMPEMRAL